MDNTDSAPSSDFLKLRAGCLLTFLGLTVPLFAFAITWLMWDVRTAGIVGLSVFALLFSLAILNFAFVRRMPWLGVSAPFLLGLLYTVMPDFIPFQLDDAAVVAAGSIFSYYLAARRMKGIPTWVLFSLLGAAVYTLIGQIIPGPVDELFVGLIALGSASSGVIQTALRNLQNKPTSSSPRRTSPFRTGKDDVIDVEARDIPVDPSEPPHQSQP